MWVIAANRMYSCCDTTPPTVGKGNRTCFRSWRRLVGVAWISMQNELCQRGAWVRAFASFQSSRGVPMLVKADNMYCGYQRGKFNSLHSCRAISASGSLGRRYPAKVAHVKYAVRKTRRQRQPQWLRRWWRRRRRDDTIIYGYKIRSQWSNLVIISKVYEAAVDNNCWQRFRQLLWFVYARYRIIAFKWSEHDGNKLVWNELNTKIV